jgi:hypothetical protein
LKRDFIPEIYLNLLETAKKSGYSLVTFEKYKAGTIPIGKFLILRHDIDALPLKALEFARVENKIGIQATYYFKIKHFLKNKELVMEISSLGHEIGYHYEDFAKAKGNPVHAIKSFEENLAGMRVSVPISTICMDGSILSKWNNLDLWTYYHYQSFGVIGEPYLDLNFEKVLYITDTGRMWNATKYSLYDKVKSQFIYKDKTSFDIISDLKNGSIPDQIMITVHPQRWHSGYFQWIKELILQWMKNRIKFLVIKYRSR